VLYQTPRGTKDILPDESHKWQFIETQVRKIFHSFNFREIRTPVFEETEIFARGIGQTTDIVQKEMYTFTDRGGKSYTLRPEMTASAVRAYIQHHFSEVQPIQKWYYIASMFRQEKPQAGRLRQFHQFGAEIFGSPEPVADVEIIQLVMEIFLQFGLQQPTLKLNSVGCPKCRLSYKELLRKILRPVFDQLCPDCRARYDTNPLRILDCKRDSCHKLTEKVPGIETYLCEDCKSHFQEVKRALTTLSIPFDLDKRLVRGLDYYTRTAFEVVSSQLGSQDALAGGGRYDLLVKELGGPETPGVGFAAGIERLLMVLEKLHLPIGEMIKPEVYLVGLGNETSTTVREQALKLRRQGVICELDLLNRSLKAQMREANKRGARLAIIIGENELQKDVAILKDMAKGEQIELPLSEITECVLNKLGKPGS